MFDSFNVSHSNVYNMQMLVLFLDYISGKSQQEVTGGFIQGNLDLPGE